MRVTVIAEAGVGHSGSVDVALKMVDAAKHAGADIVKFQSFIPLLSINLKHPQFQLLESLALRPIDFIRLAKHCADIGIEFLSTPGELQSLKMLVEEVGVKRIKIGSDDLTYIPLLNAARDAGLPVILSTGMATLDEIDMAISNIRPSFNVWPDLTLLQCTSCYPCKFEDVNLKAMLSMEEEFRLPVGYSDHTQRGLACVAAVAMGACMVEKHFELGGCPGPDSDVSTSQHGLATLVAQIREVEKMLGTGVKEPCEAEKANIPKFRKGPDGLKCG